MKEKLFNLIKDMLRFGGSVMVLIFMMATISVELVFRTNKLICDAILMGTGWLHDKIGKSINWLNY